MAKLLNVVLVRNFISTLGLIPLNFVVINIKLLSFYLLQVFVLFSILSFYVALKVNASEKIFTVGKRYT